MVLKPKKDAVRLVRRYLEKNFGLEVNDKTGLHHAPGHLTIKPSNTVIHVKGIQQESDSKANSYYPRSFDYLKKGHTQFLVLVRYDKGNLGDSFILPLKIVERIFGGLSPVKIKKGNPHYVFSIKESGGKHSVKCHQRGGEWIDIEDYKNLSGWKQIPDIIRQSHKHDTIPSNSFRGRLEQQGLMDWASLTPADIEDTANTVLGGDDEKGRLEIDREIIRRIINHLVSSKHVILVGPPGTGKTDLAKRLLKELGSRITGNPEPVIAVASYDWGRYEVIGGNSLKLDLKNENEFQFHFGCITEAISKGSFLLIDEFNRADMNKAFSEMFLAIDHGQIELREDERPPGILNHFSSHPSIVIPPAFRMICTMNDYDKSLLNELSYGLLRRFAFVDIDIPDDKEKLKKVVVQSE
ncbi:MAG: MoxR family ATPase [Candidatus Nitrosopolaris sp.]